MGKELNINVDEYFRKKDKGKSHHKWVHGNYKVEMYNLAGKLERVFEDMTDAVENNDVGATYNGILHCIKGNVKQYRNKIWRMDGGKIWRKEGEE